MNRKNTLQQGSIRYVVFKEEKVWYAVALELNIVESGDDPREALMLLFDATNGYIETAQKIKMRTDCLNQAVEKEYETLWDELESGKTGKRKEGALEVFSFGRQTLACAA